MGRLAVPAVPARQTSVVAQMSAQPGAQQDMCNNNVINCIPIEQDSSSNEPGFASASGSCVGGAPVRKSPSRNAGPAAQRHGMGPSSRGWCRRRRVLWLGGGAGGRWRRDGGCPSRARGRRRSVGGPTGVPGPCPNDGPPAWGPVGQAAAWAPGGQPGAGWGVSGVVVVVARGSNPCVLRLSPHGKGAPAGWTCLGPRL